MHALQTLLENTQWTHQLHFCYIENINNRTKRDNKPNIDSSFHFCTVIDQSLMVKFRKLQIDAFSVVDVGLMSRGKSLWNRKRVKIRSTTYWQRSCAYQCNQWHTCSHQITEVKSLRPRYKVDGWPLGKQDPAQYGGFSGRFFSLNHVQTMCRYLSGLWTHA